MSRARAASPGLSRRPGLTGPGSPAPRLARPASRAICDSSGGTSIRGTTASISVSPVAAARPLKRPVELAGCRRPVRGERIVVGGDRAHERGPVPAGDVVVALLGAVDRALDRVAVVVDDDHGRRQSVRARSSTAPARSSGRRRRRSAAPRDGPARRCRRRAAPAACSRSRPTAAGRGTSRPRVAGGCPYRRTRCPGRRARCRPGAGTARPRPTALAWRKRLVGAARQPAASAAWRSPVAPARPADGSVATSSVRRSSASPIDTGPNWAAPTLAIVGAELDRPPPVDLLAEEPAVEIGELNAGDHQRPAVLDRAREPRARWRRRRRSRRSAGSDSSTRLLPHSDVACVSGPAAISRRSCVGGRRSGVPSARRAR